MTDLVSVITPTYNAQAYLEEAILSVMAQSYGNWEMIIVDDASGDRTAEIAEMYAKKESRIRFIRLERNSGPAVARNRAIEEAEGRYIAFLDGDDIWAGSKLEKQIAFMKERDVALSYTDYYRIEESGGRKIDLIHAPERVDYRELLKQNVIGCLTAVYDTKKVGKLYMPDILKRQDFALWLDILKKVPFAYGLNEPLAYYRVRSSSISSNKIASSLYNWKLYREVEKLPWYKAVYYFGWYTYRSFQKYRPQISK
ncbi:putative N-acetylgalactosaminyl-diphosphoundecaprenol glucuronosyltransferase [Hydrogenimonas sp.]|nr:putative N-acetylgalactosaminyl-diphosphoundecaprenol glucuronosyltransferase [Hydrogenimonas sp.]